MLRFTELQLWQHETDFVTICIQLLEHHSKAFAYSTKHATVAHWDRTWPLICFLRYTWKHQLKIVTTWQTFFYAITKIRQHLKSTAKSYIIPTCGKALTLSPSACKSVVGKVGCISGPSNSKALTF